MIKKSCLNKSKFFSGFAPFKHGKKKKISAYFCARFWDSHFYLKRKVLHKFAQKCFKTTEMHSLAVCGSLCREKQFLLIFVPFYWFDQKKLFKQIKIFLGICPFSHMVRKKSFLNISVLISEIVIFKSKKKFSLWISLKIFKTAERHSLKVCASFWIEKKFLLIFVRFYLVWSKTVV